MDLRKMEICANACIGFICLILGLVLSDSNYKLLLFLMSAVFFFAIFRPRKA
jgi:hypothetical protein